MLTDTRHPWFICYELAGSSSRTREVQPALQMRRDESRSHIQNENVTMTRVRQEPRMRARPDHRLPPSAFLSSIFSLPHTVQLRLLSVVLARDIRSWLRGIPRKRPGLHTRSVSVSSPTTSSTDYPPACSPTMVSSGVIGALSTVQKDHRKHAVHMATLRAHGMSGPAW